MHKNVLLAMASLAFVPTASFAAAPTLSEVLDASGIAISGNVSGSYAYQRSSFDNNVLPSSANNTFTFDQAHLQISKLPTEGFGAVVDVFAGQDVSGGTYNYGFTGLNVDTVLGTVDANIYPRGGFNSFGAGSDINLHQAYVQYATGGLTIIAGKFATLAGYEVASDTGNLNATRSMLFAVQPFTLTGARAGYKFNDMITTYVGVSNSAGGGTVDGNDQKTVEVALALAPVKGLTTNLTYYRGTDDSAVAPGAKVKSNLADIVVAYTTGDLSLAFNGDYFTNKDSGAGFTSKTVGGALYANYQVTKVLRAGVRGEMGRVENYVINAIVDGVGPAPVIALPKAKVSAVTLTGAYAAAKNLDLVTDVRYAVLKDDVGAGFKVKETTAVVKAVYKF